MAGSCVRFVVYIERMNAMSSTLPARCGSASETHVAALAVLGELERAAHQRAGVLDDLDLAGDLVEVRLAVMLVEHRLGVEQVHLARAAVHEQVDDRLRLRREVRRPRLEVGDGSSRPRGRRPGRSRYASAAPPTARRTRCEEAAAGQVHRRRHRRHVRGPASSAHAQSTYRNAAEFMIA